MATVKIKFRASSVSAREGTLYFQIIHDRMARQINTGYKLREVEWDIGKGGVALEKTADVSRRGYLIAADEGVRVGHLRLERIILELEQAGKPYTADDVVGEYTKRAKDGGFVSFMRRHIEHLLKSNRRSTAMNVTSAMNSLLRFIGKDDLPFESVDGDLMEEYEGWLRGCGVCKNTISFYMRILRTVYNTAVSRGLSEQKKPFIYVYTGIDKTVKRAVPLSSLIRILRLDLSDSPCLDFARDLFMFSFYTRGMSFVDMCFLKKTDLAGGVLSYHRQKTGQLLQIKWEKPMQSLVEKFGMADDTYLLPIINSKESDEYAQYESALRKENRNLKKIGILAGLDTPLTTYVARHTWASIAKSKNIPIAAISEGLGHDSVNTTKIYLASLDTSVVDRANSKIIGLLKDDC